MPALLRRASVPDNLKASCPPWFLAFNDWEYDTMPAHMPVDRRQFLQQTLAAGAAASLAWSASSSPAGQSPAADYQVGIYTRPWDRHDYRVALDAIVEAGFKQAGLMTTTMPWGRLVISADTTIEQASEVGEEVRQRGLKIPSVYGGGIPVQTSLQAGIDGMKRLIDNCAAAGAKDLLMGGISREELYEPYYQAIAATCDYAADQQLSISVKPHGGTNATGPDCRKCIEFVGHDNFSLWYDPGNIFFYSHGELDPVDDAATVDGLVKVGMCIKDFDMVDRDGTPTRNVALTPGTGRVDFAKVLQRLRQGGFTQGYLVIECLAPGDGTLASLLAEAKKARAFVEQLVADLPA
ncbi:MAG: sugar phosphate isomerase/epimerase [Planctomycetaceae bacterium]|nr:MAG: sugar phosphate isomerase/epimerase [Planctomycetaceae bacterium]